MEYCPLYVTISSSLREQWRTLRVVSCLSFLDLFPRSSRKSNDCFFGAASAISSLEIIEVSIAGKHFLYHQAKALSVTLVYLVILHYNSSKIWWFCCFSAHSTDLAIQLKKTSL